MGLEALKATPAMTMHLKWAPLSGHRTQFLKWAPHPPSPLLRFSSHFLTFARRHNRHASLSVNNNNKRLGKNRALKEEEEEEEIDDDAFEALLSQLEEDLKKDDPSLFDGDDEMTEEDLAKLDAELAAIDEEIAEVFDMTGFDIEDGDDDDDDEDEDEISEEDDEEEEEQQLQLKNWQLRRLALALKTGRRKTNVCYELFL